MIKDQLEWAWYYSENEEYYRGLEYSREDAIRAAIDDECGYWKDDATGKHMITVHVMQARKVPIDLSKYFDADRFLEDLEDNLYDISNPDGDGLFADLKKDDVADLESRVRKAIQEWHYNGNVILPWTFSETKNKETVTVEIGDRE